MNAELQDVLKSLAAEVRTVLNQELAALEMHIQTITAAVERGDLAQVCQSMMDYATIASRVQSTISGKLANMPRLIKVLDPAFANKIVTSDLIMKIIGMMPQGAAPTARDAEGHQGKPSEESLNTMSDAGLILLDRLHKITCKEPDCPLAADIGAEVSRRARHQESP